MTYRNTRSWTISNDEIDSRTQSRLHKLFRRRQRHRSHSPTTTWLPFYSACQNNDLACVEPCLRKMKLEEIDHQYSPNNETALHIATRNQHKEIINTLLFYGAQRSLRNANGQQAYELAETKVIKDLFKRPKSSRFVFLHSFCKTTPSPQRRIKCKTCSLFNDDTFYEWELVDASQKALKFRYELKPTTPMNDKSLKQKLYCTIKGYLNARLLEVSTKDAARIHAYFKRALRQQDPYYVVTAYTICQNFTKLLNTDMARNVTHDLNNGCSKFSCECLYSTEDGTKAITSILLHHPKFEKLRFKGKVYRGAVVPKNALDHYKVDSCIITTTFLSTSKSVDVARMFCDKGTANPATHSYLCVYEIINDDRTALDISEISEYADENEVLILPYSAFLITKIEDGEETTTIYLKEQCLARMLGMHESQEYSIESSACLLYNTNESSSQESDSIFV